MTNYSKITALYSCLSVGDEDRDGGVKMHIRIDYRNSGKLKPVERRLATLKKALRAIGYLFQVQGQKEADRSRANTKERLQYLAARTAGTRTAQNAGYGTVTDRAAG